jgi:glycosyltransferase involved in cell wall biosynthesis
MTRPLPRIRHARLARVGSDAVVQDVPCATKTPARLDALVSRKRPRLLVLAQLPPPEHGASLINRQVVSSARLADRFELAVTPITMTAELGRIRRFELTKIWRSLALFSRVAGRLFSSEKPDLVYFSLSPGGWAFYRDLVLVALFRMAGIAHVFHLHGRGIAKAANAAAWRRAFYRFAFARAFVITLGDSLYRDIEELVARDRVFIVPNGIRDASRGEPTIPALRHPPRILFLSNMLTSKGPLVLLEALAALARRGIAFEARFAGAWRGSISPEEFSAKVHSLGLAGRVTHLGPLHSDAKARAFSEADIFALPTHYENEALPLVVIEAMMHGLPVVTTRLGALPDIVADGKTGELIQPESAAELAAALERLLRSRDLRLQYGRAARARYEHDLTDQRFEERLVSVLLRVIAKTDLH